MNAPNRIYIHPVAFPNPGLETRTDENDIEYIHSDLIPRWVSVKAKRELPENGTLVFVLDTQGCPGLDVVEHGRLGKNIAWWLFFVPPDPPKEK
jgi:hypothetical protein